MLVIHRLWQPSTKLEVKETCCGGVLSWLFFFVFVLFVSWLSGLLFFFHPEMFLEINNIFHVRLLCDKVKTLESALPGCGV